MSDKSDNTKPLADGKVEGEQREPDPDTTKIGGVTLREDMKEASGQDRTGGEEEAESLPDSLQAKEDSAKPDSSDGTLQAPNNQLDQVKENSLDIEEEASDNLEKNGSPDLENKSNKQVQEEGENKSSLPALELSKDEDKFATKDEDSSQTESSSPIKAKELKIVDSTPKIDPVVSPVPEDTSTEIKSERESAVIVKEVVVPSGQVDKNSETPVVKRKRGRPPAIESNDGEIIRSGTIRRIMKLDKDVKMTGSEAVQLVSKATEFFVGAMVDKALEKATLEDRKLVKYQDVAISTKEDPRLEFLAELLPDISKLK